jgi:hypothetical protein
MQPGIQKSRLARPEPLVIAEGTDRFAERHVDIDAVLCCLRALRVRDGPCPELSEFLFGEPLEGTPEIANTRGIGKLRDLSVSVL